MKSCVLLLISFFVFNACTSANSRAQSPQTQSTYPQEWWQPVNDPNKPAWEILPQEAMPNKEVILSKRNELGVFSNLAATPFVYHGKQYASVEGFWQMMKFPENQNDPRAKLKNWHYTREEVAKLSGFDAKHAGDIATKQMKKLNIDWVSFEAKQFSYHSQQPAQHYQLIVEAMCQKLKQNPKIKDLLLKTGDLTLKPDHIQGPHDPPEWQYFDIWMRMRERLKNNDPNFCEV